VSAIADRDLSLSLRLPEPRKQPDRVVVLHRGKARAGELRHAGMAIPVAVAL
jgi:hypothetical protein